MPSSADDSILTDDNVAETRQCLGRVSLSTLRLSTPKTRFGDDAFRAKGYELRHHESPERPLSPQTHLEWGGTVAAIPYACIFANDSVHVPNDARVQQADLFRRDTAREYAHTQ